MKKALALLFATALSISAFCQEQDENFRSSIVEGNQLMEEFNYSVALDIWLDLLRQEPDNANLNYKAGVCLWKLPKRRQESLPYFQKAIKNITDNYNPFAPAEKAAPIECYYYIGLAYHLNYQLDSAIVYYNEFKTEINHNHEFWSRTDLNIKMCENAKEAMANPVDIKIINIGGLVNSEYGDYSPAISVDESELYFTSKRLRKDSSNLYAKNPNDGEYYEDIYVTYKGDDYAWGEPQQVNFNTSDNESTLSLSADGQTLYVYKTASNGQGDIYYSTLEGSNWSDPKPMGSNINSEYHETHACVAPDGQRLYFVSNRKGSLRFPDKAHERVESKDIYFCNKLPTGEWALAQPLKELNTPYQEDGVFIHPDGKTLYFSSEGHKSIGGYDIFVSEYNEDSMTWGEPKNIGYPINTTDDDVFFITSTSGKRGYFSSIREEGFGDEDIYVISMLSFKEKPLTLLIGEIKSQNNTPIPDGIELNVTDNETKELVGTFKPRSRDHKVTVIIPPGSDYHLEYSYNDSIFFKDDIFVPENSAYQEINKAINLGTIDFSAIPKKEKKETPAPQATHGSQRPSVEGNLKYGAAGAAGVKLDLKNENQQTLANTTTDASGNFEFNELNAGTKYFVIINPEGGMVPADAQMSIKDKETGAMLPVSKLANGSFGFTTLPYIPVEDLKPMEEKDEVVVAPKEEKKVAKEAPKKTAAAPKKPAESSQPMVDMGDRYMMHEVRPEESLFAISVLYNLKFPVVQNANPDKGEIIYVGDEVKVPVPNEVMFFQTYLNYNVTGIQTESEDFKNFLKEAQKIVNEKGSAKIMIESSASKVPSAAFEGNENLTNKRADAAKEAITAGLSSMGVSADKLNFAAVSTLVRGPEYQNDAAENKETYHSYQYIKIIVK